MSSIVAHLAAILLCAEGGVVQWSKLSRVSLPPNNLLCQGCLIEDFDFSWVEVGLSILVIELFQLVLLIMLNFQNRMTLGVITFPFGAIDRHHA